MKIITRGAVAGLVGTVVMRGAMFAAKKAGMAPGELAPRGITENVQEKLGVRDRVPKPAFEASWTVLHVGYGTASGVAYALLLEKAIGVRSTLLGRSAVRGIAVSHRVLRLASRLGALPAPDPVV